MSERDYAPLSVACVRGLCDKLYEKRKFAGGEIEKMVKDFNDAKNTSQIRRLIKVLGQDLMSSTNPNVKNGALMGLSSVAVGLGEQECVEYLSELIHPIVACLSESESRVRYQAVEALFNVAKIARGAALAHFALLLDALARLAADSEPQVKQAAELLDRLVKDIVTESPRLEVAAAVRLLRERMYSRSAAARQLVASWVCVLDAVPDLPLLPHLPDLVDPLFKMLDDPNPEIRRMVDVQLNEFLRSIKKDPSQVDFQAMINVLITHAQTSEELVQLTAITWIKEFVELSGPAMLPYLSGILAAVLPCLAYADEPRKSIRETAATVNLQLTKLAGELAAGGADTIDLDAVVGVLTQMLLRTSVHTKVAALDWILHLYNKLPAEAIRALFVSLYRCWCHSPVSLLALCLLTHNYEHCNKLIATFGDLEITVDFLTEVDKLVQLIESPVFAYLRLELLGGGGGGGAGGGGAALRGALYGVLMLLPQGDAFHALRRRLQCAPPPPAPPAAPTPPPSAPAPAPADVDLAQLLAEFERVQRDHREYRMLDRNRPHPHSHPS